MAIAQQITPAWRNTNSDLTIPKMIEEGDIPLELTEKAFLDELEKAFTLKKAMYPDLSTKDFIHEEAAKFVKKQGLISLSKGLVLLLRSEFKMKVAFNMAFGGPAPAWCLPDEGRIWVNFFEPAAWHKEMVMGLILHELGHVVYTRNSEVTLKKFHKNPILAQLANILEDRRIEPLIADRMDYINRRFGELHEIFVNSVYRGDEFTEPTSLMYIASLTCGDIYENIHDQKDWRELVKKYGIKAELSTRDEGFLDAWVECVRKAQKVSSADDVANLAEEFMEKFSEYFPKTITITIKMPTGDCSETETEGKSQDTSAISDADVDMTSGEAVAGIIPPPLASDSPGKKPDRKPMKSTSAVQSADLNYDLHIVPASEFATMPNIWLGPVIEARIEAQKMARRLTIMANATLPAARAKYADSGNRLNVRRAINQEMSKGFADTPFLKKQKDKQKKPLLAFDCLIDGSGSMGVMSENPDVTALGASAGLGAFFLELSRLCPWVDARVYITTTYRYAKIARLERMEDLMALSTGVSEGFSAYTLIQERPNLLFAITDGDFCDVKDMRMFKELSQAPSFTVGLYVGPNENLDRVNKNLSIFSTSKTAPYLKDIFPYFDQLFTSQIFRRKVGHNADAMSVRKSVRPTAKFRAPQGP